jgi:hypothetical protein
LPAKYKFDLAKNKILMNPTRKSFKDSPYDTFTAGTRNVQQMGIYIHRGLSPFTYLISGIAIF